MVLFLFVMGGVLIVVSIIGAFVVWLVSGNVERVLY